MLLERWWFKAPIHSSGRLLSWKKEGWGWGCLREKSAESGRVWPPHAESSKLSAGSQTWLHLEEEL